MIQQAHASFPSVCGKDKLIFLQGHTKGEDLLPGEEATVEAINGYVQSSTPAWRMTNTAEAMGALLELVYLINTDILTSPAKTGGYRP